LAVREADPVVAFAFAVTHEALRLHKGDDAGHGARATMLFAELNALGLLRFSPDQLALSQTACENHLKPFVVVDPILGVCWDADPVC
jgi:hypothetical protein